MKDIKDLYQDYLEAGGQNDSTSFGIWLIRLNAKIKKETSTDEVVKKTIPTDSMISILIGKIERFGHNEIKNTLKKIGISNPDEFALMSTLFFMGLTSKTNLLRQCVFEITTGSQMLKRLSNEEYIIEINNPNDGRSSLIQLSKKGESKIFEAFEALSTIENLSEGLNENEKIKLIYLLEHVDKIHSKRQHIKSVIEVIEKK